MHTYTYVQERERVSEPEKDRQEGGKERNMHRKRKTLVLSTEEQALSKVMAFMCLTWNRSLSLLPLPRRLSSWEDELRHGSLPSQMETWASIPSVSVCGLHSGTMAAGESCEQIIEFQLHLQANKFEL